MVDYCDKRDQTAAHHCDHQISYAHYTEPKRFQCCYCGRLREEKPLPSSGGTMQDASSHGPFAPQTRVMY